MNIYQALPDDCDVEPGEELTWSAEVPDDFMLDGETIRVNVAPGGDLGPSGFEVDFDPEERTFEITIHHVDPQGWPFFSFEAVASGGTVYGFIQFPAGNYLGILRDLHFAIGGFLHPVSGCTPVTAPVGTLLSVTSTGVGGVAPAQAVAWVATVGSPTKDCTVNMAPSGATNAKADDVLASKTGALAFQTPVVGKGTISLKATCPGSNGDTKTGMITV